MTRRDAVAAGVLVPLSAGLAGSALHGLWYALMRYVLHGFVFTGVNGLWLAPASYCLFLALPGIPLLVLMLLRPGPLTWRIDVFVCTWVAMASVGMLFPQVALPAMLLLATGIAARCVALAGPEPRLVLPGLRRFSTAMLALVGVGAVVAREWPLTERLDHARLGPPSANAPDVLLLIIDTQRAANMGLYGYPHDTSPRLDALAPQSTVFDWAIAPAPWTLPSHASMFSGRPAGQLAARWLHPFDDAVPRIAEVMRDHGYLTAAFPANYSYAGGTSGLQAGFSRYLSRPIDLERVIRFVPPWQTVTGDRIWNAGGDWRQLRSALRTPSLAVNAIPGGRYWPAADIARKFLDWQAAQSSRPFFAFLNFLDVHEFHAPGRWPSKVHLTPPSMAGADQATRYVDSVIRSVLDTLAARHVLEHTLLIVTADHGEQFHDHGLWSHGNSLYMDLIHVPLLLRYPGVVPEGLRVAQAVSMADLAATIADLAGTGDHRLPGTSFAQTWREPASPRAPALSEVERDGSYRSIAPSADGPLRSLVDQTWHYILGPHGEQLYRYREDPEEARDLSAQPANAAALDSMRLRLRHIPFGY